MNLQTAALLFSVLVALGVAIWGLIGKTRSPIVGVIAACVGLLAAGGAWYAWAETKSTSWTIGYGLVALAALASAIRQFAAVRSAGRSG